jgi:hypothetical protein
MSEFKLYKNLLLIGSGIDACIKQNLIGSALILIYSAIDTVGWLDSNEEFATKPSFMNWVDAYLLKMKPLQCTSMELYAARCGLLHTFTPDSQLSSKGKARRICYAWGTGSVQDLQRTIELADKTSEYVAVHVNDLYQTWRLGVLQFTEILDKDPNRKPRVYNKARKFFSEIGIDTISDVVTKFEKGKGS